MRRFNPILLAFLSLTVPVAGQQLIQLANDLNRPLLATHAGDGSGRLFIVEQSGRVRIYQNGELLPTPFLDVSNRVAGIEGEGGLLGLAFHPDHENNGRFYIYYFTEPPRRTRCLPSTGSVRLQT